MRKILFTSVFSLFMLSLLFTSLSASLNGPPPSIVVNTNSDNAIANDTLCTLREAITNANMDTDTTSGDCNAGAGNDTITFVTSYTIILSDNLPSITSTITISSANHNIALDGANNYRVFRVQNDGSLDLSNLTIQNGWGNYQGIGNIGGGLLNYSGTVTITNVTFNQNRVDDIEPKGGAIYNSSGQIYIDSSTFSENEASDGGGAIFNQNGTVTITNTTFLTNTGGYGAAILNEGTLQLMNSQLISNTASREGGGLYNSFGAATINTSTFNKNNANYGGGISVRSGQVTLDASSIINNIANQGGGGLYNEGGQLAIQNGSLVDGNVANGEGGGGILFDGDEPDETTTIRHSTISNNISNEDYGAGIYASDDGDEDGILLIEHTVISGNINYADEGSGVVTYGPTMTITHSAIVNNINYEEGDAGVGLGRQQPSSIPPFPAIKPPRQ